MSDSNMGSEVVNDGTENSSFLSSVDIILIAALMFAGIWWLFRKQKPDVSTSSVKSYSIQ